MTPTETTSTGTPGTETPHAGQEHHHHRPAMNEQCRREVTVNVPAEVVAGETEKLVQRYQKIARVPGFRAGKVPASIIRSRFKDEIRSEVLDSLLPEHFRKAVDEAKLSPISQPHVSDLKFEEGAPLTFKAAFEILPEIEVKGYKKLAAEKQDITVSDEEVAQALQQLRERQASFDPVEERALTLGDFAQVSFTGLAKGAEKIVAKKEELATEGEAPAAPAIPEQKPIEVKDVLVEIGGKGTVKEFTDNLTGAKPGETRTFDVHYADDFADQRLAGQVVNYTVIVQAIKKKTLPELNDDFAKELGDFKTLDDLRARIRENMEAERRHEIEHTAKEKLIDQLVEQNDFPVPQSLLDRQIETRLERGFRALAAQGMRMEDMKRMNFERLREGQKPAALREVKASLLLDKIAEVEGITATDEDINREIESAAAQSQQPAAAVRERLQKDGALDRIRDRIRNEKALDFLYRQSA